ncbi:MAG TPA: TonB-dependent receptor [bacterium]|nr:TonB-dependent receptor [bacterium]
MRARRPPPAISRRPVLALALALLLGLALTLGPLSAAAQTAGPTADAVPDKPSGQADGAPSSGGAAQAEVEVQAGTQVVRPVAGPEAPQPLPTDRYQAGATTVIPRAAFADTQKTVADVLAGVPGVTVTRSGDGLGATHVSIRGSRSDQVLVLLDGVPLQASGDNPAQRLAQGRSGVDLASIPLDEVASIRIVRGAASSLYGPGAAAGAIVITTRHATEPALRVAGTVGSDGYREGDVAWTLPLSRPKPAAGAPGAAGTAPALPDTLSLHANVRRSDGSYVFFDPGAANGTTTIPTDNPCAVPLGSDLFRRGCNATRDASLQADWRHGSARHVSARVERLRRDGLGGVQDPRPYGLEVERRARLAYEDAHTLGGRDDNAGGSAGSGGKADAGTGAAPEALRLSWRADAERLHLERNENTTDPASLQAAYADDRAGGQLSARRWLGRHRLEAGAALQREVLDDARFTAVRSTAALFGAWDYHPSGGTWEASLRHDALSDVGGRSTGRVALSQTLAGAWGVKASHGTGYRPPTLFERYDPGSFGDTSVANPDLRPETSASTDGGVFYAPSDDVYAELLAFRQDTRQQIIAIPAPGSPNLFRFENVNRTRSTGLEATLSLRLPHGLAADGAWTRQDATILDNDAVDPRDNGHQVPGVPDVRWNVALNWRQAGWHGWLQARHSGRRFVDTANTRYLEPYTVADAGLTVPLGRGWSLSLEGRNLGNVTYAELDNFPPPGRQWFLTLRWEEGHPPPSESPPASPRPGASTGAAPAPLAQGGG